MAWSYDDRTAAGVTEDRIRHLIIKVTLSPSQSWEVFLCRAEGIVRCEVGGHPMKPDQEYIEQELVEGEHRTSPRRYCRVHGEAICTTLAPPFGF